MEGHRYADEEPSWYPGPGQYTRSTGSETSGSHTAGSPYDSGVHERPSGAFRLPEQRAELGATNPYALTDPLNPAGHARSSDTDTALRVPVRGPEYPTVRKTSDSALSAAPMAPPVPAPMAPPISVPMGAPTAEPPVGAPTRLVPPVPAERPGRPADSVYQTRRPVTSFLVAIVMIVLMVPVLRLLIGETFTGDPTARGIVPAVLLTLGFTLTGIGLFAVARGGPISRESWLRPPIAYLPAGLILLLAAGLAVA